MELKMEEQEETARIGSESRKRERLIDVLTPYILCIISNFFFAGLIIVVKVSLDRGFSPYVLVPYGQALGALTTGVLALLYERFPSNFSFLLSVISYYYWRQPSSSSSSSFCFFLLKYFRACLYNLVSFLQILQLTTSMDSGSLCHRHDTRK